MEQLPEIPRRRLQLGEISLHLILTIFLGFGMVLFGTLAVVAYSNNATTQANLHSLQDQAAAKSAADQKRQDNIANAKANELPYRTYTSDAKFGSFQLQIPKDWSLYVGQNATNATTASSTQLDIAAGPGQVVYNLASGANIINTFAFRLQLENRPIIDVTKDYASKLKKSLTGGPPQLASKSVQVSGIASTWLEGAIDNQRHNGIVVLVPTRNQTMVIETDTHDYVSEFNTILSSAVIYP